MTIDDILAASRRLTLAEQSRLLAALAQQIAATVAAEQAAPTDVDEAPDSWAQILQLADQHGVATGIGDLAHQHDHYLYGTARRSEGE